MCIVIEYTTQSSFWPWDSDGFQFLRWKYEVYACQTIRIVGCFLSRLSLVLNDFLTIPVVHYGTDACQRDVNGRDNG